MKGDHLEGINRRGEGKDTEKERGLKYTTCVCLKTA
jgi:hypothetical protein